MSDPQKKPNAADYEAIPDVEQQPPTTTSEPTDDMSGFDPKQIELLSNLDETIKNNTSFQFDLPSVSSTDMITQGKSMISGMITPTITTVGATITAFLLSAANQATETTNGIEHSITAIGILLLPYINAIIVFITSFQPIQDRCMTSVEPIFAKVDTMQDTVQTSVKDISKNMDTTIDTLQTNVTDTIQPILPTLQTATQYETMIRTVKSDIDIPDATDIDREFDEARTVLTNPIDEAISKITNMSTDSIPYPLQSSSKFYWAIVFPIALVCLGTQLGTVFYSTSKTNNISSLSVSNITNSITIPSSKLLMDNITSTIDTSTKQLRGSSFTVMENLIPLSITDVRNEIPSTETLSSNVTDAITSTKDDLILQKENVMNNLNSSFTNLTSGVNSMINEYKNEFESFESNVQDQVQTYKNEMAEQVQQYKEQINDYETTIDTEVQNAIGPAKSMIQSIVLSYIMAIVQIGIVYLLTSPKVKAWMMNRLMQHVSYKVDKTLRSTGVPSAMDDIFGVRMVRIRTKVYKLFTFVQTVQSILQKLGLGGDGNSSNPIASLGGGAVTKLSSKFGFGK